MRSACTARTRNCKDEVIELARKYGIVTPYTAYLILEDEQRRGLSQDVRTFRELEGNARALAESRDLYRRFNRESTGDFAVAGAKSYQSLKMAESPQNAVAASAADAFRYAPAAAPSAVRERAVAARGSAYGGTFVNGSAPPTAPSSQELASEFARQGKYVNGRTFYQNGQQWIDSEIQKKPNASRVRLVFGSDEYLRVHPEASSNARLAGHWPEPPFPPRRHHLRNPGNRRMRGTGLAPSQCSGSHHGTHACWAEGIPE